MGKRSSNPVLLAKIPPSKPGGYRAFALSIVVATLVCSPGSAQAQIAKVSNNDGRMFFVNAEPPASLKLAPRRPRGICLPAEVSFTGGNRPALDLNRDGAEKLVREAAERHRVDPALIRAVIETES